MNIEDIEGTLSYMIVKGAVTKEVHLCLPLKKFESYPSSFWVVDVEIKESREEHRPGHRERFDLPNNMCVDDNHESCTRHDGIPYKYKAARPYKWYDVRELLNNVNK